MHIIEMITIGSQAGSQAFGKVCHRLVDVFFLWQLFPDGLQSDCHFINRVEFWLSLWQFSSTAAQM